MRDYTKFFTAVLSLTLLALSGCGEFVNEGRAKSTLLDEGYKDIAITAKHGVLPASWFGCSGSDDVAFTAAATNVAGRRVEVTVCCGWGVVAAKGCTVRH